MTPSTMPVLLLTGYLGSGKTTLLNRILSNTKGIRFAVIVNDIGEVNIDAELIQKGGIVGQQNSGDLIALQNGCICCTLQSDLMEQIRDLIATRKFDYIVIEASGICEPEPIAQTIEAMRATVDTDKYLGGTAPKIDCIVTVVDALRMKDEFGCGVALDRNKAGEDDIENLVIQQIEFCNIILLNKISEVSAEEAAEIKATIRAIQPHAQILECDYADVDLSSLLNTEIFDFEKTATSAAWVRGIEGDIEEEEHHHHCHHDHNHECECDHHHHHHHGEGEAEEYGISTFVYYRRPAFDIHMLDHFIATKWPKSIIRTKGVLYFSHNHDMSFLFEQAGTQKKLTQAGLWYATAPADELAAMMAREPQLMRDWDESYGDRMIKLVFIGKNMNQQAIIEELDKCLEKQFQHYILSLNTLAPHSKKTS